MAAILIVWWGYFGQGGPFFTGMSQIQVEFSYPNMFDRRMKLSCHFHPIFIMNMIRIELE